MTSLAYNLPHTDNFNPNEERTFSSSSIGTDYSSYEKIISIFKKNYIDFSEHLTLCKTLWQHPAIDTSTVSAYFGERLKLFIVGDAIDYFINPNALAENVDSILDQLLVEPDFKEIEKSSIVKTITDMLSGIPTEKLPEEELCKRIRKVLLVENLYGSLSTLTSEEIAKFDDAVKRRPLFK